MCVFGRTESWIDYQLDCIIEISNSINIDCNWSDRKSMVSYMRLRDHIFCVRAARPTLARHLAQPREFKWNIPDSVGPEGENEIKWIVLVLAKKRSIRFIFSCSCFLYLNFIADFGNVSSKYIHPRCLAHPHTHTHRSAGATKNRWFNAHTEMEWNSPFPPTSAEICFMLQKVEMTDISLKIKTKEIRHWFSSFCWSMKK